MGGVLLSRRYTWGLLAAWGRLMRLCGRGASAACQAVEELVYPPFCFACERDMAEWAGGFCAGCVAELVASAPACPRCAAAVGPYSDCQGGCLECRSQRLRFEAAVRLGYYSGKLRQLCLAFKTSGYEVLGTALTTLFWEHRSASLRALRPDLVVAVPLHPLRRLARGFNQAELLAEQLAQRLKVPHRSRILKRRRWTAPQSRLGREQRRHNVAGAFRARKAADLQGACVLLVDDILTTGATCSEAAGALKRAGARRVVVGVIARSQEHSGA